MILMDAAPAPIFTPEAEGSFDFVLLGSPVAAVGIVLAVAAVVVAAALLIVKALRKKK